MAISKKGKKIKPEWLHGYRSGLEERVALQLKEAGVHADYETTTISYIKPSKPSRYTPDFILPNGIVIETKGRFMVADRQKHLIIKKQYPALDIRFVFSNSKSRISKASKTTYAMWCEKHGFKYADKTIPTDWLQEEANGHSHAALVIAEHRKKTK